MSIDTMFLKRLARRLGMATDAQGDARASAWEWEAPAPLRWRAPWLKWQSLSWMTVTLLAPPFWTIGALLMIDPRSDQPLFWPAAMAVVALANAAAIVATNQRHHRKPFASRRAVAGHYFAVGMGVACALLMLLLDGTGAIGGLVGPLVAKTQCPHSPAIVLWVAGIVAGFGISSSMHASILHAWFAFEA
ncbi:hypothetical protein [Trinickia fusca]|uniref:Uncharacterized protein n=1 Tax=Trinickia fusca TaxID=2419777 RepID=A0A494XPD6_9BURK|nr:hypothetical protein [Trinickia fusca]RKP52488.1 hypothetical protein D7S89_02950 [Trinickia fusca]